MKERGGLDWLLIYITSWLIVSMLTIPLTFHYCRRYLRIHHTSEAIRRGELTNATPKRVNNLISLKTLLIGFVGTLSFLLVFFYAGIYHQRNV
jgi:hypothetical protein